MTTIPILMSFTSGVLIGFAFWGGEEMDRVTMPEFPDIAPSDDWDSVLDCINTYTEAYAAAKVREALEAAATIADAEAENARKQRYYPGVVGMLTECAADIRALTPPRHNNK